ncbi:type VII secretion integral membrane protein EccD [Mycolicibacterium flavescens]|uniref:Type VII secretion integral membrane protein EccD n=1 Tax=Mycolicibacterium flavescens TaxID=1776 RepID=A0A1E3RPK1_MYCFV|nr:type VII secretion integral membrane protein EccD [Mycolicibacterium flavescens]MCV7283258.1 type VII secretion integral membrane protein EccD [Mycolicibacterium flavescens]ODQ91823.1 type VII secretion integral membrane protein EccD [Mycolicibacterium flavescens]
MTGIEELRTVDTVSAAPELMRVAVLGGRTQLDVALPAEVAVAAFLPELSRLITSRDAPRDDELADRDGRRTFWVLRRAEGGAVLAPDQTLRDAGVTNGELLMLTQQEALTPPTLYDDVVDAAARLNRTSYAAWDAVAARVMAVAGLWACAAVWIYLLTAEALSAHRAVVAGGATLTVVTLVGGATLAHRVLARRDIAALAGVPVVMLTGALGWTAAGNSGPVAIAVAAAVVAAATALCLWLIGAGKGIYVAALVVSTTGALSSLAVAAGADSAAVAVVVATSAILLCLCVPRLTTRWNRVPVAHVRTADRADQFGSAGEAEVDAGAAMPSAEEVWTRVRSATLTRAGLLAGLAIVVIASVGALVQRETTGQAMVFAVVCAAVLALRGCRLTHAAERFALSVPAVALVLFGCVQVQHGDPWLAATGIVVLGVLAAASVTAGLTLVGSRPPRWLSTAAAYVDYCAVAAVIPAALWPLGVYEWLAP